MLESNLVQKRFPTKKQRLGGGGGGENGPVEEGSLKEFFFFQASFIAYVNHCCGAGAASE